MELFIIILFIILGLLLIVAEILLLPGVTVAGFLSILSFTTSLILAYLNYGTVASFIVVGVSLCLSIITVLLCLRKNSLKSMSLNTVVGASVENNIHSVLKAGDTVTTYTRLAPMGNIITETGEIFEGKSLDGYIEAKRSVNIINIENNIAIVKKSF